MKDEAVLNLLARRKQAQMVDANSSVENAIRAMDEARSDVIACSIHGRFAGLFTRFDYLKFIMLKNLDAKLVRLMEVMNFDVAVIRPNTKVSEAFSILSRKNINCITVLAESNNSFLGIISEEEIRKDIHQALVSAEKENRMIMSYIYGENYGLCANY